MKKKVVLLLLMLGAGVLVFSLKSCGFFDPESFRLFFSFLAVHPFISPLLFCAAYVLLAVFLIPTLPLNLGAGVLWGATLGSLFSILGTMLASVASFSIARYLFQGRFRQRFSRGMWAAILQDVENNDWKVIAFTRLNPAFPTGLLNYCYGVTSIPLGKYTWTTLLFIAPATVVIAYLGSFLGDFYLRGRSQEIMNRVLVISMAVAVLALFKYMANRHGLAKAAASHSGIPLVEENR